MTRKTLAAANATLGAALAGRLNQQVRLDEMRGTIHALESANTMKASEIDKLETRLLWVATHIETVATWDIYPDLPAFCLAVDKEIDGVVDDIEETKRIE